MKAIEGHRSRIRRQVRPGILKPYRNVSRVVDYLALSVPVWRQVQFPLERALSPFEMRKATLSSVVRLYGGGS